MLDASVAAVRGSAARNERAVHNRDRGVKDWGHMIEGHGGMLDRLDSVCFAAPFFFHLVRSGWT